MRLKSYNQLYRVRQLKTDGNNNSFECVFSKNEWKETVETDGNNNSLNVYSQRMNEKKQVKLMAIVTLFCNIFFFWLGNKIGLLSHIFEEKGGQFRFLGI